MICKYCGKLLGTNEDAENHAGECEVMNSDNSPPNLPQAEAPQSRSVNTLLCAGLPCDDEIDQVATDEGALWIKSKIVNK